MLKSFQGLRAAWGSPQVKNKIVQSLRWAVANALPRADAPALRERQADVRRGQDLGLEYTLARMLEARK
ncbi:MAG: hypothetical protein R3F43_23320 [bacterium]